MLADINGHTLGLLDAVRGGEGLAGEIDPDTPLIVLTAARGRARRGCGCSTAAAMTCVAKPFSYPELRGRIRALLRRAHQRPPARVSRVGALTRQPPDSRGPRRRAAGVELAAKEYELLQALIAEPTRVFTREELLRGIWGHATFGRTRTLDSHAFRLRQKLAAAEPGRALVINVWGVGYRLCDSEVRR